MTASRPVILAGGGVYYSRAYDELVKLAEMWGAAVITTMASKSVFPEDHPLYGWHGGSKGTEVGNYLCRTADVVLSLGCRFADETTSSYRKGITYNFPETKLIQVDIDPREIGKNYPCDLGILGDVKSVMNQLIKRFEEQGKKPAYRETEYYRDIQRAKSEWFEKLKTSREKEMVPVTISQFLEELSKVYPKNGVIVTSSGNAQAQVFQEYCFSVPGTHITTGGFSTMGFGFNAAMGAKLAMPDTPVMAIIGDGDFMMAMQELSTAAQYDIPVIVVVMNNCGWLAIKDLQADVYGEQYTFGSDFTTKDGSIYSPDFKAVADAFGVYSQIISRKEEVVPAVQKALASGRPSLIEVLVNRTYPYSGGKATGWWDVPVPAYIKDKYEEYIRAKNEEYLR